jgi:hypothetical protein
VESVRLLLLLLACHKAPENAVASSAPVAPKPAGGFSSGEKSAIATLGARDPEPDCASIGLDLPDRTGSLVRIAEGVTAPPWVSVRAASCVVDVAAEPAAEEALARWVSSAEWAGLGMAAVNLLDRMPEEVAARVAADALEGPIADQARDEIAASTHASVRALVEP